MFHSGEMRWFYPGMLEAGVDRWFRKTSLAREEDERVDAYLLLPGCRTTGVKIREGRFEIKAQTGPPKLAAYANGIRGYRDSWVKWSCGLAEGVDFHATMTSEEDRWAMVAKRRLLRQFSLDSSTPEELAYGTPLPGAGCQVETTDIRVLSRWQFDRPPTQKAWRDAARWWSFSLEAFGRPGEVLHTLDRMASQDILGDLGVSLDEHASMSYPGWLDTL